MSLGITVSVDARYTFVSIVLATKLSRKTLTSDDLLSLAECPSLQQQRPHRGGRGVLVFPIPGLCRVRSFFDKVPESWIRSDIAARVLLRKTIGQSAHELSANIVTTEAGRRTSEE